MAGKYIITNLNYKSKEFIFAGLNNNKSFYEIGIFDKHNTSELSNIYIGIVKDVVPSINAAFVEYLPGKKGYYSLEHNKRHIFLNKKNTDKIVCGDLIVVQISKEGVKTKDPVLTSNINFTGRYSALSVGKTSAMIGISSKIKDDTIRDYLKKELSDLASDDYGIIVRTNAATVPIAEVKKELIELIEAWKTMYEKALTRTKYTILQQNEPEYVNRITGFYENEIDEIITDDRSIFEKLSSKVSTPVRFYEDSLLPLYKLYSIESTLDSVLSNRVWLKSGGYLVIEYTEAMTVIDVNTGKFNKGKNMAASVKKVNLEAAYEIARQIRLRNISGIIIIDFINMTNKEEERELINEVSLILSKDPIRTNVIDMTGLGLLEVTRRKTTPPLHEILKNI